MRRGFDGRAGGGGRRGRGYVWGGGMLAGNVVILLVDGWGRGRRIYVLNVLFVFSIENVSS